MIQIKEECAGCSRLWAVQPLTLLLPLPIATPAVPCWSRHTWLVLALGSGSCGPWTSSLVCPDPPCHSNPQPLLCPYLKRLQESSVAPILELVLFWAQSQHGLRVGMELIVKVVQEGSPRPVLEGKRVVELARGAQMCPLPGGSRHLAEGQLHPGDRGDLRPGWTPRSRMLSLTPWLHAQPSALFPLLLLPVPPQPPSFTC